MKYRIRIAQQILAELLRERSLLIKTISEISSTYPRDIEMCSFCEKHVKIIDDKFLELQEYAGKLNLPLEMEST